MINPTSNDIGRRVFFKKLVLQDTTEDSENRVIVRKIYEKEYGTISKITDMWIFVRYDFGIAATHRKDLEWSNV